MCQLVFNTIFPFYLLFITNSFFKILHRHLSNSMVFKTNYTLPIGITWGTLESSLFLCPIHRNSDLIDLICCLDSGIFKTLLILIQRLRMTALSIFTCILTHLPNYN